MTTKTAGRDQLADALADVHSEIHELLDAIAAKADAVDPDTANWGHVGNLGWIASQLRNAMGAE
jgi:hypothetical protein